MTQNSDKLAKALAEMIEWRNTDLFEPEILETIIAALSHRGCSCEGLVEVEQMIEQIEHIECHLLIGFKENGLTKSNCGALLKWARANLDRLEALAAHRCTLYQPQPACSCEGLVGALEFYAMGDYWPDIYGRGEMVEDNGERAREALTAHRCTNSTNQ